MRSQQVPDELGRSLAEAFGLESAPCSSGDLARALRRGNKRFALAELVAERSRHEVRAGAKRFFTHCALDALMLPFLLGARIELRSTSPLDGAVVEVFADTSSFRALHDRAILSLGVRREPRGPVHEVACPLINLFPSLEDYERWSAGQPDALLTPLSLDEAFTLARSLVGDSAASLRTPAGHTTDL